MTKIQPLDFSRVPIVGKDGSASWNMLRWFQKIQTQVDTALTVEGINPNAPSDGTNKTVGGATQNLSATGQLPTTSLTGSVGGAQVGFNLDEVPDGAAR